MKIDPSYRPSLVEGNGDLSLLIDLYSEDEVLRMDSGTRIAYAIHLSLQPSLLRTPEGTPCAKYQRCEADLTRADLLAFCQALSKISRFIWLRIPLVKSDAESRDATPKESGKAAMLIDLLNL
ncbi:unnamed protein product [Eruca vesicaria subsp. sativa]|uniref:Uncharacterized protein n=1 Tax=Eruca vesicaria subsp. sativa TaxID=29727 RepID=A0ABC8LH17_ERUVS|nr:unnamed protein product [Eruca vesicaria subsp. sativa]